MHPRSTNGPQAALQRALPVAVAVLFLAIYLLNLAPDPTPDGQAYLDLVRAGDPFHAQHLIYGLPLLAALKLFPQQNPVQVAGTLAAVFGAYAVGSFSFLLQRLRIPLGGVVTGALILGLGSGWMAQSTAWEVHVAAVGTVFLACGLALGPRGRPWGSAIAMTVGILLHKTMILALPAAFMLSLWGQERWGRRLLGMLGLTALLGMLAYGAVGAQRLQRGQAAQDVAIELVLGELRSEQARPVVEAPLRSARDTLPTVLLRIQPQQRGPTSLALCLVILGLAGAGAVQLWRRGERRELAVLLWPALGLPAAVAFEAFNFEYYMGPVAVLLGVGMGALRGRASWALLPLVAGAGAWNHLELGVAGGSETPVHQPRGRDRPGPARTPADG